MKKRILITGANSGIGFETAKELLRRGYPVILACRTEDKAETAKKELIENYGASASEIALLAIDLASFESTKNAADHIPKDLWGLICNAGLSYAGPARYTKNGIEETFGVNHLGHFLLVNLLIKKFKNLKRITIVSSAGHDPAEGTPFPPPNISDLSQLAHPSNPEKYENGNLRYANSKLCNILFTYELVKQLKTAGRLEVVVNAYNPGMVPGTGLAGQGPAIVRFLWLYILPLFNRILPRVRRPGQAGKELSDVATNMDIHGKYVDKTIVKPSSEASYDEAKARALWAFSEKLVKGYLY